MVSPDAVILLCSDLMMTSRLSAIADRHGLKFCRVSSVDELSPAAAQYPEAIVVWDFGMSSISPDEVAAVLNDEQRSRAIAYGPHVRTQRMEAASLAGIGLVIARGRFDQHAESLIHERLTTGSDADSPEII
ncbi:MAG: hypothetical protein KDA91_16115 [Planctomycetaceae bacterium]|nr:hypothetical protein [Planctomycetaceae bacterium]